MRKLESFEEKVAEYARQFEKLRREKRTRETLIKVREATAAKRKAAAALKSRRWTNNYKKAIAKLKRETKEKKLLKM
jgi:hypothetical protein